MIGTYVPKNSYVVDQTVSPETESFFKVYTSQNESDERFNPLLVTIQSEINEASMVDIVQYCALVAERFKYLPTVLIIANKESLGSNEQNRHLVKLKSTFWAEKCLMFLSDLYITPLNNQPRNAFYALCQFLSHPDKKFSLSSDVENQSINLVVENSM
ncbi:uncharacterized protein EV154DRAFT_496368 [Mucor mucedo]|uniref:uncharacterized protein n=1 Tax=Mucor mucedo TaxID=29922 RepID=UPI00221FCA9E|nr:uncharacterized protein EV154DRAFT_496368 [Mucor mucedo]KAI7895243.1 hypothetical protein EV154DRAFT_496368 [Mucor mucedo]